MEKFTSKELQQIERYGISREKAHQHLQTFEQGICFTELVAPATLENGIRKLSKEELKFYAEKYERENREIVKFVPASGAATRMFKDLQGFQSLEDLNVNTSEYANIQTFFEYLPEFAFYEELLFETKKHCPNFNYFSEDEKKNELLKTLLNEDKLNFSDLPKGLVPFHKYPQETRTAFEEHLVEAALYGAKNGRAKLHFTIGKEHLEKFETEFSRIKNRVENATGIQFDLTFSFQQKNTDTLAVDMENRPFRDGAGTLCFRPAGHGALLGNLNQMNADIVFIKNIDNVSTEKNLSTIVDYKKALAGILLEIQEKAFGFLEKLHQRENSETFENHREQTVTFLKEVLNVQREPESFGEIINLLNRPIRICGMVKNAGEPGGGPFWIKDGYGNTSLQIVEMAQIDSKNHRQSGILEKATHFNPVDLVCGVKNFKGEKFNLSEFSNPQRGFITQKSANGADLKALELPGLWNGAMEYWNSIFVEVPVETFNPVKTVLDLLQLEHL